jgi:hypothetical protein
MPSLWVDLLHLHGYVTDPAWLRKPMTERRAPLTSHQQQPHDTLTKRVARSFRLCLGIGDGALRTQ